ncbi:MAG: Bifunctional protein FolD, partial [Parcubacteria group bacterium GW2011_GWE2_39_37]
CDADIKEEALLAMVDFLNEDEMIDAILIQLPLPDGIDTDRVIARMKPEKDVDGFHPENLKKLLSSCDYEIEPPLIGVILAILEDINFSISDKKVVALVNWKVLGDVVKHVLECRGARVEIVHADDSDLKRKTQQADVLIVAIGKEKFVTAEMLKQDAVVIDVGINQCADGSICGDVNEADVSEKAGYLTPVPGGVGPLTIATAFKNTVYLCKKRKK